MGLPEDEGPATCDVAALSAVCKAWKIMDLESMRAGLDETGLKIAEQQEDAANNRRKLADYTREFKRTVGENLPGIKGLAVLLKAYQDEIDRLTKRSKHGECSFLELYQKLYDAPDPAPALAVAFETASRVADLEAQNKKLSHELAEYKAESASIRNQDLTIRKLEEKVRVLEAAVEEKGMEVDEARAEALAEADAARMEQMQEREAQLTTMLTEAQASLSTMQRLHTSTQNQLFAMQSQTEEERVGRHTEVDLATVELERAQERLVALERQLAANNGADQLQLKSSQAKPGAATLAAVEETLRHELHTQREVASRLRMEVTNLRLELEQGSNMWEARVGGLRASLQATEQHARALEQELAMRPTNQQVEDLRVQIRLLQAVGYNSIAEDEEGEGAEAGGTAGGPGGSAAERVSSGGRAGGPPSLEAMLLQKNRHLEHDLTMAKLKVVDSKTQLDSLSAQMADVESRLAAKAALLRRLETDLAESRRHGKPGTAGSAGAQPALSNLLGETGKVQPGQEEEGAEESSMFRVVCSQRDRFRARVVELEEEVLRVRAQLSAAKSEAGAAKADSIALVERLRFVHGFKAQQQGQTGDVEVGADAERRYGRLYDEGINPFKEFQGEQRANQKSNLHFADRLMYMFGQLVFGSQGARLGTFLYLVIMHLLVLGSLMRMTHHSSNALIEHQQGILDSRHAITAVMQHAQEVLAPGDIRLP